MVKTILLVDDDPVVLNCISDLLQRSGYTVITEREASAALARTDAGANFDLVITDYQMAGMDGLEFLCRFRQMRPAVPAIMLTGHGTLESYQKAIGLGATACLPKPFKSRELMCLVAFALGGAADAGVCGASTSQEAGLSSGREGGPARRMPAHRM